MIRAVLFDFDGLLVDSETIFYQVYAELLREFSVSFTRSDYLAGYSGRPVPAIAKAFVQDFALPLNDAAVEQRILSSEEKLRKAGVPLKPGAATLLRWLTEHSYRIAVASSSKHDRAMEILSHHGLVEYFEAQVFVEDISRGKPDPEVFLTAAKRLGITPEQCLVLEDSRMGIEAAAAAGMPVICVPDMQTPDEAHRQMTAAVVNNLADVIDYLSAEHAQ